MKAVIFSDLHLAHCDLEYPLDFPSDAEVAIVAGDVWAPVSSSLKWLYDEVVCRGLKVVFVAGNHEHYNYVLAESMSDGFAIRSRYPGLHWLENEMVVIDGVRFAGATLWTDYNLYAQARRSIKVAMLGMNDHRIIYTVDAAGHRGRFYPEDALAIHQQSRAWLEDELAKPFDGPTVVVTHHCPHPGSIHRRFSGDTLNPAFISDLTPVIQRHRPNFWIHGHTHSSFDYVVGETRIVCNPRGYVRPTFSGFDTENVDFEPFKMIEI
ncbi:MAG: metallophosphoesterase [Planctomycetaceae bacterium]|nr:metallophosphoesterase [Planctomycetaceae bacterium]